MTRLIYIITLIGLSMDIYAQTNNIELIYQKDKVLSNFIDGKLSPEKAYSEFDGIQQKLKRVNTPHYIEIYLLKGLTFANGSKYDAAIREYKKGIDLLEKVKNDTLLFKFLSNTAGIYQRKTDIDSATIYFEKGYQIIKTNSELKENLINYCIAFLNNYSLVYQIQGDFKTTDLFLNEALELTKSDNLKPFRAFILGNLAQNNIELSNTEKAINYLTEAVKLVVRNEDRADKYLKISELQLKNKQFDKVLNNIQAAEKAFENSELRRAGSVFPSIEIRINLVYGKYYFQTNQPEKAKSYFEKVLKINQKYFQSEKGAYIAESLNYLGKITNDQLYFDRAIKASLSGNYEPNQLGLSGILSPKMLLESQIEKAKLLSQNQDKNAEQSYLDAIMTASRVRKSFYFSESKAFYAERVFPIYESALNDLTNLPAERSYEIIEYSKNATLADVLADQKIKAKNVDAKLLNEELALTNNRNKTQVKLLNSKSADEKVKLEKELNDIQLKISQLAKEIEKKSPNYYELKYHNSIPKPKEIQAVLDDQTAIISYLLGQKKLFVSIISKDKLSYKSIPTDSSFGVNLKTFISLLYKKPALGNYKGSALAQSLYNQLIKPIESELKNRKRLVILRDAELNFLPFEVLESRPNQYLLRDFAISYTYSATIWYQALRNKPIENKNSLLSIAPYTAQNTLPATFRDQTLKPLPASGDEVQQIGGTIYKDNAATKSRFMEDYRKHGIIHFATHAQIDDTDPSKSFVAFYPQGADYKLFTDELYNLSLQNTRLVVLSACEAGRGKLQKGEGLMSLARGFAYSGCPSVVTTLWNAHDESMALLSERLHHYLQDNQPIDISLQKAKLDYFDSKIGRELDHPYYWANFILIGNYEPVNESSGFNWWIWGLIGVVLVGLIYWLWRSKIFLNIKNTKRH